MFKIKFTCENCQQIGEVDFNRNEILSKLYPLENKVVYCLKCRKYMDVTEKMVKELREKELKDRIKEVLHQYHAERRVQ